MIKLGIRIFSLCLFLAIAHGGDGFRPLFAGKDLSGWKVVNTAPSTWSFSEEGYLVCTGVPTGEIRTERMYQNFILELEWRHLVPKGNAGIFVWSDDITAKGKPFIRAVEIQVLENAYGNTKNYSTHGDIFPIQGAKMKPFNGRGGSRAFPTENRSNPSPEWNHYRIECQDGKVSLAVNGKVVTRGEESIPRKGYICIESEGGTVHYRNVRIKELPDTPVSEDHIAISDRGFRCLYSGVDFAGWKMADGWRSKDWELVAGKAASPLATKDSFSGDHEFIVDFLCEEAAEVSIGFAGGEIVIDANHESLEKPGTYNRLQGRVVDSTLTWTLNDKAGGAHKAAEPKGGPLVLSAAGGSRWANPYVRKLPQSGPDDINLEGKVLFLGDSITHAGHYISNLEAHLLESGVDPASFELINLGLPSEGVTGLSEPSHPFPRPNVHERLKRALDIIEPDLVFACYGMNDGIYYPYSDERFSEYTQGMEKLIEEVNGREIPLVLMTPPPFDPEPLRRKGKLKAAGADEYSWSEIYADYDEEVIEVYGQWVLEQKNRVSAVIDLRTPVLAYVEERRKRNPDFTLSNDGVHLNEEGHVVMAEGILNQLPNNHGPLTPNKETLEAVHERQMTLHHAWLSHVGHLRPGVKQGLPLWIAKAIVALPETETPEALFTGKDLSGWEGDSNFWQVENGMIAGRNTDPVPSSTYLFTKEAYREFRLLFEMKQTRSPEHSTMHSAVAALGEVIEDTGGNAFGFKGPLLMFAQDWGIWDAHRRNRIVPQGHKGRFATDTEKPGEWNQIEILVKGNRIRFVNNGQLVFDFTDSPDMLTESPIGLQLHKNEKPQEFFFRGFVLSENPSDRLVTLKR